MAGLTLSGAGSGLDIQSLVNQLVAAERAPAETRINKREREINTLLSAFGRLKSALSNFSDTLDGLKNASTFRDRTATSSDEQVATVTASSGASAASYTLDVTRIAQAHKLTAGGGYGGQTGTITLEIGQYDAGTNSFTATQSATLTIDSSNNTIQGIRDAINDAGIGISATIINDGTNDILSITADDTGSANTIRMAVSGDSDGNDADGSGLSALAFDPTGNGPSHATEISQAQDAEFTIDGIAITSSSNVLTTTIAGLNVELKSAGNATLTVEEDIESAKEKIQSFVDAYNELSSTIRELTKYGGEGGEHGALLSDSAVFGIDMRIRSIIGSASSGGGSFSSLMEIGFASDPETGRLKLDTTELENALKTDFDGVGELVSEYTSQLSDYVETQLGIDGVLTTRTEGLNATLKDLGEQRDALELRIESVRARYMAQFSRLDSLIASLNSTGTFLAQQLAGLPGAKG